MSDYKDDNDNSEEYDPKEPDKTIESNHIENTFVSPQETITNAENTIITGESSEKTITSPTEQTVNTSGEKGNSIQTKKVDVGIVDHSHLQKGSKIGRYEIIQKIGAGGMGAVFKAFDSTLQRDVAIKFVLGMREKDRFLIEAQATAKLNHANIISLYDILEINDDDLAIVMEYVPGETLADVMKKQGILAIDKSMSIIKSMAQALAFAHKMGIIHRDIKPSNVMIDNNYNVKIMDFGLAKLLSFNQSNVELTNPNTILGTPAYMSPEQIERKEITGKTDVYSLGITLYQMLTKELPFAGDDIVQILTAHLQNNPRPISEINSSIPKEIIDIVDNMMLRDVRERYEAVDVVRKIDEYFAGGMSGAQVSTHREIIIKEHMIKLWISDAQKALDKKDYTTALKCYREVLKNEPDNQIINDKIRNIYQGIVTEVQLLMEHQKWQEAFSLCNNKLVKLFPEENEAIYLLKLCKTEIQLKQRSSKNFKVMVALVACLFIVFAVFSLREKNQKQNTENTEVVNKQDILIQWKNIESLVNENRWGEATSQLEIMKNGTPESLEQRKIEDHIVLIKECRRGEEEEISENWEEALTIYVNARELSEGMIRDALNGKIKACEKHVKELKLFNNLLNRAEEFTQKKLYDAAIEILKQAKEYKVKKMLIQDVDIKIIELQNLKKRIVLQPNIQNNQNKEESKTETEIKQVDIAEKKEEEQKDIKIEEVKKEIKKQHDQRNPEVNIHNQNSTENPIICEYMKNGFYQLYIKEYKPGCLYTWDLVGETILCGQRVYYKFSSSGERKIILTVDNSKEVRRYELVVEIPKANVDQNLSDRSFVYNLFEEDAQNAFANQDIIEKVNLPGTPTDARLAMGGLYLLIRLEERRNLLVYNLILRKFEEDIVLPDAEAIFAVGGKYLVSYSRTKDIVVFYDFLKQETLEQKFSYKISDIVMGLDNGKQVFITITVEDNRRNNIRYGLLDIENGTIELFAEDTQNRFSHDNHVEWRTDAYLYNLTCHRSSGSPWGMQWIKLHNKEIEVEYEHTTSGYLPLSSDGQYIVCSQGKIYKDEVTNSIKRETSHVFPIYGSSYYLAYKKGKRYNDPGEFVVKDFYNLEMIKEIDAALSITAHPFHVKDYHYIASAIADSFIQIDDKKNNMFIIKMGIRK